MASQLKVDEITTVSGTGTLKIAGNVQVNAADNTSGIVLPNGTEAQRAAAPVLGETRINNENKTIEFYNGTGWQRVSTTPAVSNSVVAMHYKIFGDVYNTSGPNQVYTNHPGSTLTFNTTETGSSFVMYADIVGYQAGTGSGVNIAFEFNGVRYAGEPGSSGDTWMGAVHSGISSGAFNLKKMWTVSPNLAAGTSVRILRISEATCSTGETSVTSAASSVLASPPARAPAPSAPARVRGVRFPPEV